MSHPLQSPAWGQFRRTMGTDVEKIRSGIITFHKITFTPYCIGYFPKGPLPDKKMIAELTKLGNEKNAVFIQIEPDATTGSVPLPKSHHPLFTKSTFILDLTKSEDELLATMHPKTRYNIRVAQKHGVIIKEDNSDTAFETYLKLSEETTARQKFYAHNRLYHQRMWDTLYKAGVAHLFTATHQNHILAAWIIFIWKNSIYYPYGASSREHREVMAPYLMLWEIARWAKTHNVKHFDLWGADPAHGFHRFKEGFAPKLVEYVGSYDLVLKPFLYQLYTIADTIRWTILRNI